MDVIASKLMCWFFNACTHQEVMRLLEYHGALIGFLVVVITSGVVGVAFTCRRRSALETEMERMVEEARRRMSDTTFRDR